MARGIVGGLAEFALFLTDARPAMPATMRARHDRPDDVLGAKTATDMTLLVPDQNRNQDLWSLPGPDHAPKRKPCSLTADALRTLECVQIHRWEQD